MILLEQNAKTLTNLLMAAFVIVVGVIFWDIYGLHHQIVWHYFLLKGMTLSILALSIWYYKNDKNHLIVSFVSMIALYIYAMYGMIFIDFTYIYAFWEITFGLSFFFGLSRIHYNGLFFFGLTLNLISMFFCKETPNIESIRPQFIIATIIMNGLAYVAYHIATNAKEKHFELQEKFAQIGKQTGYVFHEIRKPINRLLAEESHQTNDIKKINSILLNIGLILNNKNEFQKSFENFSLLNLYDRIINEFSPFFAHKDIQIQLPKNELTIYANASLFEQAIKNIILNAIEAINDSSTQDERPQIIIEHNLIDNGLNILIKNSHSKISTKNLDEIFSPFYSTKSNSSNNGLGLSFCKNIIDGHNGKIQLLQDSKLVVFSIFIPNKDYAI